MNTNWEMWNHRQKKNEMKNELSTAILYIIIIILLLFLIWTEKLDISRLRRSLKTRADKYQKTELGL